MHLLQFERGPWYLVYSWAVYVVVAINFSMMGYLLKEGSYWQRRQACLLLAASFLPVVLDLGRLAGVEPVPGFSMAPAMMPISGLLIVWAVLGYRLLDVSPIARAALLDVVPAVVVVLDNNGRIADMNRRMCEVVHSSVKDLTGIDPNCLDAPWADWLTIDWMPEEEDALLCWEDHEAGVKRYFKRSIHPLSDREKLVGHLIHIDDVTALHEAGIALAERERSRDQARLMKELHDAVGGISAHVGLLAQSALQDESAETRQAALRGIIGLSREMGVEVRRFISILEQPDFGWNDWMLDIKTFCRSALTGLPIQLHLEIESDSDARVISSAVGLSVYRLIKECITNVIKHAQASDVWVTARLERDELFVEVRDNGRGFDAEPQSSGDLRISRRVCRSWADGLRR